MPRNGSGTYSLPPGNPVVTGTTISSTVQNNTMSDVASALTSSIAKDGQTTPTANLPMGGFKHTGVANATASDQYASYGQLQSSENDFWLTSVSGSNTIAATAPTAFSVYNAGQTFRWVQPTTNTSAVTINVSTQGAKNILKRMSGGIVALVPNDLVGGVEYSATYDGTQCVLNEQRAYSHGADIASASTINLDTATGDCVDVTGTTTITAITLGEGEQRTVRFTGILILTNGANLDLGGANITTSVGDYALFRGYASGVVRLVSYSAVAIRTQIQSITAIQATGAVTTTYAGGLLEFRSATQNSGISTPVKVPSNSGVIPSGATLGLPTAQAGRIIIVEYYNSGSPIIGWINSAGGIQVDENNLVSPTTISAAATSASTFYSASAVSANSPYRIIGFFDAVNTAGAWSSPINVQGVGGFAGIPNGIGGAINNTSASSDIVLQIGQSAYIDVSGATSVPLHIATGDNQQYEITLDMQSGSSGNSGNVVLNPNNTTITNQFGAAGLIVNGNTASQFTAYFNSFLLAYSQDVRQTIARVCTKTISKAVTSTAYGLTNPINLYFTTLASAWLGAASTAANLDTTTAWTSLGTVVFPVATTGRILIRRIA